MPQDDRPHEKAYSATPDYDAQESEFLAAIARWRNAHGRAPTLIEGFHIALSLGWQFVPAPEDPCTPKELPSA